MKAAAASSQPAASRQSACRNNSHLPLAAAAPVISCGPRPRGPATTRAPAAFAIATVPSREPPSLTTISPTSSDPASAAKAPGSSAAASSVGITTEINFCSLNVLICSSYLAHAYAGHPPAAQGTRRRKQRKRPLRDREADAVRRWLGLFGRRAGAAGDDAVGRRDAHDHRPQRLARHRLRPLDQPVSRLRARLHLLLCAAEPRLSRPVARSRF